MFCEIKLKGIFRSLSLKFLTLLFVHWTSPQVCLKQSSPFFPLPPNISPFPTLKGTFHHPPSKLRNQVTPWFLLSQMPQVSSITKSLHSHPSPQSLKCILISVQLFLRFFWPFLLSLYSIRYNIASVLCFIFLAVRPLGPQIPDQPRIEPTPPTLEGKISTTGLLGKSQFQYNSDGLQHDLSEMSIKQCHCSASSPPWLLLPRVPE